MPSKKIHRPFIFMNHQVIHPDQKPIKPIMRPVVISGLVPRNPYNVKFL